MPTERTPQAETSPLVVPLQWVTRWAVRFPWTTLGIALAVTLLAVGLTATRLGFRNSRADLLNPKSEYHRRWLAYTHEFGDREDVVVVVEGRDPARVLAAVRDAAATIARENRLFTAVMHDIDLSRLRAKGLYFLPPDKLAESQAFVARMAPMLHGDWDMANLGEIVARMSSGMMRQMSAMSPNGALMSPNGSAPPDHASLSPELAAMAARYREAPAAAASAAGATALPAAAQEAIAALAQELDPVSTMLLAALETQPGEYHSPWPAMTLEGNSQLAAFGANQPGAAASNLAAGNSAAAPNCCPLMSSDGGRGLVLLQLAQTDGSSFDPHTRGLSALRRLLGNLKAKHPDVEIGLTGLPVIENDEMQASQNSMARASVLSLIGVGIVFLAGFGGLRHPLIGNLVLLFGMAWSFGFATLAIGHLNILSSAFGAILIGQGLDFGVYYLAGYLQHRREARTAREALLETASTVGPGIATGAVSTAIAFFAAGFTEFSGVAELGMIAGGGILLCFLAAIVLLPAMIQISDARRPATAMPSPLDLDIFLRPLYRRPHLALGIAGGLTILAGLGMTKLWYDHNLMHLQPVGLESVTLGQQLASDSNQGAYFAISIAPTRQEALARKQALLHLPSVDRVDEIASALPECDAAQASRITWIHEHLRELPASVPQIPTMPPQQLAANVGGLLQMLPPTESMAAIRQRLARVVALVAQLPPAEYYARLSDYQQAFAGDVLQRLMIVRSVSDPMPPQLGDLPEGLTERFVGRNGKFLLRVYSKADIWDMPATEQFVRELRSVDPEATGNPLQIYEASRQMKRSYEDAALYAVFIVIFVVYLDFRSIRYTLLALAPLGISMVQMFGLMGLLNIPLNPANMIVLPLILGIGVDNGVHIVHDFRRQRAEGGRYRIGASTVNAVVINSLGNMVGFGSLMIASHQGLQSLGRVLTIGMGCCLATALVMPNLFLLFSRQGGQAADPAADATTAEESPAPVYESWLRDTPPALSPHEAYAQAERESVRADEERRHAA